MHNCVTLTPPSPPPSLPLAAFLASHSRSSSTQSIGGPEAESRSSSRGSMEELSQPRHKDASSAPSCGSTAGMKQKMLLDYNVYMAKLVSLQAPQRSPTATDSPGHSPESSPKATKKVLKDINRCSNLSHQNLVFVLSSLLLGCELTSMNQLRM